MFTAPYETALDAAAERAPALPTSLPTGKSNNFFSWVEDVSVIIADIYFKDCNEVLEDLVDRIKEVNELND
jgi:hypothetical protein